MRSGSAGQFKASRSSTTTYVHVVYDTRNWESDPDGEPYVTYWVPTPIYYVRSATDGRTWSSPTRLGKGGLPTIATGGEHLYAIW